MPASGRDQRAPAPEPATPDGPTAELDTDGVVVGPRPDPDRSQTAAGAPVLPAPAPVGTSPTIATGATPAPFDDLAGPAPDGPTGDAPADAGEPAPDDQLAAPRPDGVPSLFEVPELTQRVVVPVVVLVAVLAYLLAQGRIDRRGELLVAPLTPGTEHDDDVFEL